MNNVWHKTQQNAFLKVAHALNGAEIRWTVLRNYEGLPAQNDSKDVDISLCYSDRKRALSLIDHALLECGFKFKKEIRFSFCYSVVYFSVSKCQVDSLKIDLFWGLQLKGFLLQSPDALHAGSIDLGLFRGANKTISSVFNFVTSIVSDGKLRDKYLIPLVKEYEQNQDGVKKCLSAIMDEEMRERFEKDIKSSNISSIKTYLSELSRSIKQTTFRKQPLGVVFRTLRRWYYRLHQFVYNKGGAFISFHGKNCTSQQMLIDEFIRQYCDAFVIDTYSVILRDYRLNTAQKYKAGGVHNRHELVEITTLGTKSFASFLIFDIFEYFTRIKREMLYHKTVVYKGYIYDVLWDTRGMNIRLPYYIRMFLVCAMPGPSMSYHVEVKDEWIHTIGNQKNVDSDIDEEIYFRNEMKKSERLVLLKTADNLEKVATKALVSLIMKSCKVITIV